MNRQSTLKNRQTPDQARRARVCSRRSNQMIRAAGCAAYEIFSNCKKYNPNNQSSYLSCVFHLLFIIIRSGAPREVPVPNDVNRSTISDAQSRFVEGIEERLRFFEEQAKWKRRPVQPKIVTQAMGMIPSARSGRGPQKAKALLAQIPEWLKPIHRLLSNGIELLWLRERFLKRKSGRLP